MHPLRIEAMAAKVQPVLDVDAVPTGAADAIRHIRGLWPALGDEYAFPNMREDVNTGTLLEAIGATPRGHIVTWSFDVEMKGAGAAYSSVTPIRPEIDPLLVACGLLRTHVDTASSESVAYTLADTGHEMCTIYVWAGGELHKVLNCQGTAVFTATAGQLARITFTMSGMLTNPTTASIPDPLTYDATESPAIVGLGLQLNAGSAWTPNFPSFVLDLGNEVVRLDDGNGSDGLERFAIPSRAPRFTLTARTVALATYNPYALRAANTLHTLTATIGSTQYNRFDLESTDLRPIERPGKVEDNGFTAWSLPFQVRDLTLRFD